MPLLCESRPIAGDPALAMTDEKKTPGPKPETFKVDLPFEEAVKAALKTPPPKKPKRVKPKR